MHPTCGPTQPGDIDGPTRIKTYEVLQEEPEYKKWAGESFRWSYLPYSMKMAGPREAIQHMIIRKNFGATHFIIGRDMAGTHPICSKKPKLCSLTKAVVTGFTWTSSQEEHADQRGFLRCVRGGAAGCKSTKACPKVLMILV